MIKPYWSLIVIGSVLLSSPASAIKFSYQASDGCGEVLARVPTSGAAMGSLVIEFLDFETNTSSLNMNARNCEFETSVRVPAGMQFRPVQALADGEVSTSENGSAYFAMEYDWGMDIEKTSEHFGPQVLDSFLAKTPLRDDWMFTKCEPSEQFVTVKGRFYLGATRHEQDASNSDIAMFNAEQQGRLKTRWMWQWKSCREGNPWKHRKFRSQYTSPAGNWVYGKTVLEGKDGYYRTDSGHTGTLQKIKYSDDYRVAQGFWRFKNGSRGWFKFSLAMDQASFDGTWGFGEVIGKDSKGQWKGELYDE